MVARLIVSKPNVHQPHLALCISFYNDVRTSSECTHAINEVQAPKMIAENVGDLSLKSVFLEARPAFKDDPMIRADRNYLEAGWALRAIHKAGFMTAFASSSPRAFCEA